MPTTPFSMIMLPKSAAQSQTRRPIAPPTPTAVLRSLESGSHPDIDGLICVQETTEYDKMLWKIVLLEMKMARRLSCARYSKCCTLYPLHRLSIMSRCQNPQCDFLPFFTSLVPTLCDLSSNDTEIPESGGCIQSCSKENLRRAFLSRGLRLATVTRSASAGFRALFL